MKELYLCIVKNTYCGRDDTDYKNDRFVASSPESIYEHLLKNNGELCDDFSKERIIEAITKCETLYPNHSWGGYGLEVEKIKSL